MVRESTATGFPLAIKMKEITKESRNLNGNQKSAKANERKEKNGKQNQRKRKNVKANTRKEKKLKESKKENDRK